MSLAFLDVMFCGFGAVILIFLILDHASTVSPEESNPELAAEIDLLEEEVEEGQIGLVEIRNILSDVSLEVVTAEGLARQIMEQIDSFLQAPTYMSKNIERQMALEDLSGLSSRPRTPSAYQCA